MILLIGIHFQEDFLLFKIGFDDFLSENHDETIRVKEELEKEAYKTQALEVKLARLTEQSKTIQREIYNLEQPLKQQKMCQRFLYKVSPELWRAEQDDKPSVELDDDKFIDKTGISSGKVTCAISFKIVENRVHRISFHIQQIRKSRFL